MGVCPASLHVFCRSGEPATVYLEVSCGVGSGNMRWMDPYYNKYQLGIDPLWLTSAAAQAVIWGTKGFCISWLASTWKYRCCCLVNTKVNVSWQKHSSERHILLRMGLHWCYLTAHCIWLRHYSLISTWRYSLVWYGKLRNGIWLAFPLPTVHLIGDRGYARCICLVQQERGSFTFSPCEKCEKISSA